MENGRGWRILQRLAVVIIALLTLGNALLLFFVGSTGPIPGYPQTLLSGAGFAKLAAGILLALGAAAMGSQRWARPLFALAGVALLLAAALLLALAWHFQGRPQASDYIFDALICMVLALLTPWWRRRRF